MQAFLKYWQLKRRGFAARPSKFDQLNSAKQKFLNSLPKHVDALKRLRQLERQFHDLDTRFHHQGG
jgi:hypothetical protein